MGNYNNKNFKMTDANVIVETATADCPIVNLTLTGANKDDTETFVAAGYTDGYLAEVELTWEATYWAVMTDGTAPRPPVSLPELTMTTRSLPPPTPTVPGSPSKP